MEKGVPALVACACSSRHCWARKRTSERELALLNVTGVTLCDGDTLPRIALPANVRFAKKRAGMLTTESCPMLRPPLENTAKGVKDRPGPHFQTRTSGHWRVSRFISDAIKVYARPPKLQLLKLFLFIVPTFRTGGICPAS